MDHSQHASMQISMSHEGMDHSMPGMDDDRCSMNVCGSLFFCLSIIP